MTPRTVMRRLVRRPRRRRVGEVIERLGDRVREATGGLRRRWHDVPPPPGGLAGVRYVLVRGCACPVPVWLAGPEFEPDPEAAPPAPAITWRHSTYFDRPPVSTRWDWRPVGEPHPFGPDPEHDPPRPPL